MRGLQSKAIWRKGIIFLRISTYLGKEIGVLRMVSFIKFSNYEKDITLKYMNSCNLEIPGHMSKKPKKNLGKDSNFE